MGERREMGFVRGGFTDALSLSSEGAVCSRTSVRLKRERPE